VLLFGLLFAPSSHAPLNLGGMPCLECIRPRPRPRRRHSTTPERVVSMPGRGHDDEPDLPARTADAQARGQSRHAGSTPSPAAILVPIAQHSAAAALIRWSRCIRPGPRWPPSSHHTQSAPVSRICCCIFLSLHAGLSSLTARSRSRSCPGQRDSSWHRRWAAAASMQLVDAP
jgi:hypothetical protein